MTAADAATKPGNKADIKGSFYSPLIDFLLLGGGSIIAFPLILLIFKDETHMVAWSAALIALSYVVNFPHFAQSYQIFYRNFKQKIRGEGLPKSIHLRYVFSGVLLPLLFVAFYSYAIWNSNIKLIGQSVNIMFFFVGWHYVKQGYGIAIVCSVLKRNFFDKKDKNILLINAYCIWALAWVAANIAVSKADFFGLEYYSFDMPDSVFTPLLAVSLLSGSAAIWVFVKKYITTKGEKSFPFNGVVAYFCALYAWTLFATINPFYMLVIPAFHSLQYSTVVWRYEYNRLRATGTDGMAAPFKKATQALSVYFKNQECVAMAIYICTGVALGAAGFYFIPLAMQYVGAKIGVDALNVAKDTSVFMLICWVFINVHHYFIDNVIWKKENPEIKQHLFS